MYSRPEKGRHNVRLVSYEKLCACLDRIKRKPYLGESSIASIEHQSPPETNPIAPLASLRLYEWCVSPCSISLYTNGRNRIPSFVARQLVGHRIYPRSERDIRMQNATVFSTVEWKNTPRRNPAIHQGSGYRKKPSTMTAI